MPLNCDAIGGIPSVKTDSTSPNSRIINIGIQAGHGNGDPGAAFCSNQKEDSNLKNEADINYSIAKEVENNLTGLDPNFRVSLFVGGDQKIRGFDGDVFISLHSDQGVPGVSGYKISRYGGIAGLGTNGSGDDSDQLVATLWEEYGKSTELQKDLNPGHYPTRMLNYYALDWISKKTPGVIIEMGWLCDDLPILLFQQEKVAEGIANGILRFLQYPQTPAILAPLPSGASIGVTIESSSSNNSNFPILVPKFYITTSNLDSLVQLGQWRNETLQSLDQSIDQVNTIAFSPDSKFFALGTHKGYLHILSIPNGKLLYELEKGRNYIIESIAFSPDGNYLAYLKHGSPTLRKISNGDIIFEIHSHYGVYNLAFSPSGNYIAGGYADGTIQFWNVHDGGIFMTFSHLSDSALNNHPHHIDAIAFSPDNKIFASASEFSIWVFKLPSGEILEKFIDLGRNVNDICFSHNGNLLAAAIGHVFVWDVSSRTLILETEVDDTYIPELRLAFSPTDEIIASGSQNGLIILRRVSDGKLLKILNGHNKSITALTFSPDGKYLASASEDGLIHFWGINPKSSSLTPSP